MKKKVACLIIWLLLSFAFIWCLQDSGRRTGGKIQDSIEFYVEKNLNSTEPTAENVAKSLTNDFIQRNYYVLSDWFKEEKQYIAFVVIAYIGGTIACYHFAFKN